MANPAVKKLGQLRRAAKQDHNLTGKGTTLRKVTASGLRKAKKQALASGEKRPTRGPGSGKVTSGITRFKRKK